ncbi:O-antigen ligase family protein [Desulfomicrobium salsuginis]
MIFYYIMLFLLPFNNHPILSYNMNGITPVKFFGGLALCVALVEIFGKGWGQGQFRTPISKLFMAFIIAYYAALIANHSNNYNPQDVLRFNSIVIFFVTTVILVNNKERFINVIYVLLACMNVASAYVIREYILYGWKYENFRPSGLFGDPNYSALNLLTVIPVAVLLCRKSQNGKVRFFSYVSLFLYLTALGLTQSRGAFVAFGVMTVPLMFALKFQPRTIAVLSLLIGVVLAFMPVDLSSRFDLERTGVRRSTDSRYELIVAGWNMSKRHMLFGVGPGNFKVNSALYNEMVARNQIAHNSYVSLAAELGLPGIIVFALIALRVLGSLKRLSAGDAVDAPVSLIASGMRIGLIGYLVGALFLSAEYEKLFWLYCFVTAAVARFTFATVSNGSVIAAAGKLRRTHADGRVPG